MAWQNDLASVLGIPAGAATLAVAIYAACTAAEKAASQQALADIGRILKNTTWERSVRPSAIIERVFVWTFGERQLSWKCVSRSIVASAVVLSLVALMHRHELASWSFGGTSSLVWFDTALLLISFFAASVIPDYISIGKTRLLTTVIDTVYGHTILIVIFDIILSLIISAVSIYLGRALVFAYYSYSICDMNPGPYSVCKLSISRILYGFTALIETKQDLSYYLGIGRGFTYFVMPIPETLMTSIWTILIVLATTALKLLAPVHRFTAWFFDVEKHPVQAIGIVAGALVMLGSLIWSVLRAVI
jgi:hypothetical protein